MPLRLPDYDALLAASARGAWDPGAIDLDADAARRGALPSAVRSRLDGLLAGFLVGEEAVAEHLPPIGSAAEHRGLAACLVAQAAEEERHAVAMRRVWSRLGPGGDPRDLLPPRFVALFEQRLPRVARAAADESGRLTDAVGLYHGLLEGIVFIVGQQTTVDLAREHGLVGLAATFARIQRDERWHVALGLRVLVDRGADAAFAARLLADAGEVADCWGPLVDPAVRDVALDAVRRRLRATGLLDPAPAAA